MPVLFTEGLEAWLQPEDGPLDGSSEGKPGQVLLPPHDLTQMMPTPALWQSAFSSLSKKAV